MVDLMTTQKPVVETSNAPVLLGEPAASGLTNIEIPFIVGGALFGSCVLIGIAKWMCGDSPPGYEVVGSKPNMVVFTN